MEPQRLHELNVITFIGLLKSPNTKRFVWLRLPIDTQFRLTVNFREVEYMGVPPTKICIVPKGTMINFYMVLKGLYLLAR